MYLLDVITMSVKYFSDEKSCPSYAILSHTWGDGEVTFQDLSTPHVKSMVGYRKIEESCKLAKQDGFEYVWIDTCCINKTSSAELQEAINSMYKWYQQARVCYVYLFDMPPADHLTTSGPNLSTCRWFTRGWTLQELLASRSVVFYNKNWVEIGTKCTLREEISNITAIPCDVLLYEQPLDEICIAQRMSWAARRETTRVEDAAYCLMGIFNVNMPILYGEGSKAFIRLQLEIIKDSIDHSLFAWAIPTTKVLRLEDRVDSSEKVIRVPSDLTDVWDWSVGLFASSPQAFQWSQGVRQLDMRGEKHPFSMTNNGLRIKLPLVPVPQSTKPTKAFYPRLASRPQSSNTTKAITKYQAILNCKIGDQNGPLVVHLQQDDEGRYCRNLDPR